MADRWVCKRCFAANDESAGQCAACGLVRGSEAPASEQWQPAAAPPASSGGSRWLAVLARFWWIPVAILIAVGGSLFAASRDDSGQITDGGDLGIADLRPGDCFDLKDASEELIDDVEAKPCSDTHEFEMFFVGSLSGDAYPSEDVMTGYVIDNCIPAFDTYVGMDYQSSMYDIFHFVPSEDGWDAGDHTVQCAVFHPTDDELTGSLKGAAQ